MFYLQGADNCLYYSNKWFLLFTKIEQMKNLDCTTCDFFQSGYIHNSKGVHGIHELFVIECSHPDVVNKSLFCPFNIPEWCPLKNKK